MRVLVGCVVMCLFIERSGVKSASDEKLCGRPESGVGLIVHGQDLARGDFPWAVPLLRARNGGNLRFFCGGTLVSLSHVVTAGHCLQPKGFYEKAVPRDISALFGAYDLNQPHESGQFALSPTQIFLHNDWNPFVTSYDADIAVLKFEANEIPFTSYIRPICLWENPIESEVNEGYVVGWGKSEDETKEHENIPKKIKIPIFTNEKCSLETPALASLSSGRTFCAGWQNGTGVCFGDSGNGFAIKVDQVFYLKGIVSSSTITSTKHCDVSKFAVYTNVLKFNTWINQIVNNTKKFQIREHSSTDLRLSTEVITSTVEPNTAEVTCKFFNYTWLNNEFSLEKLRTCEISDQTIGNDGFLIDSPLDLSVQGLTVSNTSKVTSLPEKLDSLFPGLLVIQINDFNIRSIGDSDLKGLKSLKFLDLKSNSIEWISSESFHDLTDLEVLSLYRNKIEYLGGNIFDSLVKVRQIELYGNKIEFLHENIFQKLVNLKTVSLYDNKLISIPKNLFLNNLKLKAIDLNSNKIKFISSLMFNHLKNLYYVDLQANVCIQKYFYIKNTKNAVALMRADIASNCQESESNYAESNHETNVFRFVMLMIILTSL